jgi:hypothetical protein
MTVLEGHIDHLGRPVLTIETAGPEPESFLCVLDTGFNRTLLILRPLAFGLGFKPYTPQIVGPISLADHKDHAAEVMSGRINWLGEALAG